MGRESGLYWVKFNTGWEVARYNSDTNCWEIFGSNSDWWDYEFDEIDEIKIEHP